MQVIGMRAHCTFRREIGWHTSGPVPLNPGACQCCNGPLVVVEDHTDWPVMGEDREGKFIMVIDLDPASQLYGQAVRAYDHQPAYEVPGRRNALIYLMDMHAWAGLSAVVDVTGQLNRIVGTIEPILEAMNDPDYASGSSRDAGSDGSPAQ